MAGWCIAPSSPTLLSSPRHRYSLPTPPPNPPFSQTLKTPLITRTTQLRHRLRLHFNPPLSPSASHGGPNNNDGGSGGGGGDNGDDGDDSYRSVGFSALLIFALWRLGSARVLAEPIPGDETVHEVRGGKWILLVPSGDGDDSFVADSDRPGKGRPLESSLTALLVKCRDVWTQVMLPEGFPQSVTSDYLEYSLWRAVQGVASQVSGVLATQALLYSVGLGRGAIPVAAAVNWVLKDGIGYLSKIMLSKYGRHFDVHPKGWRLFADLLENAAFGLEIITPAFPHLFVPIGAVAGAGRSAAALIQAATRSCFFAGFAAQRNFAEVIAKGEAQGMVSKSIGIAIGIGLANFIGSSMPLAFASFSVVTVIHMYCNLKSYQSIQIRTLNPYRASLVFSEYLLSGQAPPIKEVNDEEPLFPAVPSLNIKPVTTDNLSVLSSEAKIAAVEIEKRLQLGSKLSEIVQSKEDVEALFNLYRNEGYILAEHKGKFCVVLKETCTQHDMLKAVFQVNYIFWLENNAGIGPRSLSLDCEPGGRLHLSLDYVAREFNHAKTESESTGWAVDGLIARPLPIRVRPGYSESSNPAQ